MIEKLIELGTYNFPPPSLLEHRYITVSIGKWITFCEKVVVILVEIRHERTAANSMLVVFYVYYSVVLYVPIDNVLL